MGSKKLPVDNTAKQARPFLKWAGGKRQLLEQLDTYFPDELRAGQLERYIEPFVGSGAVFFRVVQSYPLQECLIADINAELILVYRVVKQDVEGLIAKLREIEDQYLLLDEANRREFYYRVRRRYNEQRRITQFNTYEPGWTDRAAYMLFLNRTGYNGLFRLNSKGEFNVPVGRYKNPKILNAGNLRRAAQLLSQVTIQYCDFEKVADQVDDQSFVYFDPPYRPLSTTAHFTAYSENRFDDRQQLRLAAFYRQLDARGGKLMLSNSDPHNVNPKDDFFEEAYRGFRIERLQAKRNISSDPAKRGPISELLILNYD